MATETITIKAPDMRILVVRLIGDAPLMIHNFSAKATEEMVAKQAAGSTSRKGKAREAKSPDAVCDAARHISTEGWDGISAGAFRNAMISACRVAGFKMTLAKLSLFVIADGYDKNTGTPLVRINGTWERNTMPARNATGVIDIRHRPMWREWSMDLRVRYDADQFTATDVMNLLQRVGMQVGVGEGRPDSKMSAGIGLGTFRLATEADEARDAA